MSLDMNITARRVCILHELGTVADSACDSDPSQRANIMNSLARHVGSNGGQRSELVALAGYALASVEAMDEAAA